MKNDLNVLFDGVLERARRATEKGDFEKADRLYRLCWDIHIQAIVQ